MIEHEPLEIVSDDEAEAPEASVANHTVRDILMVALVTRLPCPVCGDLDPCDCPPPPGYSKAEARAEMIEAALIEYGHLPESEGRVKPFNPEEAAQWLAERSGFPRYTAVTDGWRRLLEAEADVELAAIKAGQRVAGGEGGQVKAVKAALMTWHQSRSV